MIGPIQNWLLFKVMTGIQAGEPEPAFISLPSKLYAEYCAELAETNGPDVDGFYPAPTILGIPVFNLADMAPAYPSHLSPSRN